MTKQEWYQQEHAFRAERRAEEVAANAERVRKAKLRAVRKAHQTWLVRKALKVVIAYNHEGFERAQRMADIFG